MQVETGVMLALGGFVFSMGMGWAILRGTFQKLLQKLTELVNGLNAQTAVTREVNDSQIKVTELLKDLNLKHTRANADDHGFGTVEVERKIDAIMTEVRELATQQKADRRVHELEHRALLDKLNTLVDA